MSMSREPSDEMIKYVRDVIVGIVPDDVPNPIAVVKAARYVYNWVAMTPGEVEMAEEDNSIVWTVYNAYEFDLNN